MGFPSYDNTPLLNALAGAFGVPPHTPALNALVATRPESGNAMVAFALPPTSPLLRFSAPPPEPEVPEAERRFVAWANLPGDPSSAFKVARCGRLIWWLAYGDRESVFGWEVDHRIPVRLGGRATRSNLIARHWLDNAESGGALGAALRKYKAGQR
jgi:hypothetical protein